MNMSSDSLKNLISGQQAKKTVTSVTKGSCIRTEIHEMQIFDAVSFWSR